MTCYKYNSASIKFPLEIHGGSFTGESPVLHKHTGGLHVPPLVTLHVAECAEARALEVALLVSTLSLATKLCPNLRVYMYELCISQNLIRRDDENAPSRDFQTSRLFTCILFSLPVLTLITQCAFQKGYKSVTKVLCQPVNCTYVSFYQPTLRRNKE